MTGPLIYSISEDPVAAAKVLNDFAKTNDKLILKAGSFAGKVLDKAGVQALASIPSRNELLGPVAWHHAGAGDRFCLCASALAKATKKQLPDRAVSFYEYSRFRSLLIMAITKEDILEAVGSMTVMELNDLVKAFEEKFGVSAASMAVAARLRPPRWSRSRPSLPSC
jgi:hypothetical protein